MKQLITILLLIASSVSLMAAQKGDLEKQLHDFLAGATINDLASHDTFWADELVYTSSNGTRFGKKTIIDGVKESGRVELSKVTTIYRAAEVNVRYVDTMALVDFLLVAEQKDAENLFYLNSGTFIWRDGRWQAINWQGTEKSTD